MIDNIIGMYGMRFKAKTSLYNNWVYGNLVSRYNPMQNKEYYYIHQNNMRDEPPAGTWTQVDPKTTCMCVAQDKHGVPLYTGDRVTIDFGAPFGKHDGHITVERCNGYVVVGVIDVDAEDDYPLPLNSPHYIIKATGENIYD